MRKKQFIVPALLGITLVVAGCGSSSTPKDEAGKSAAADAPPAYSQNCAACHGAGLEGRGGTPGLSKVGAKLSEEQIKNKIAKGGGGMPGFQSKLNQDEISQLTTWLAAKK